MAEPEERPRVVLATRNDHKLRELGEILTAIELVPLPDEVELPPETGETFAENALGKARAARDATGLPTLADDSGIAAEALGGRPGVRSARFAGEQASDQDNLDLLRAQLRERDDKRVAYIAALAYIDGSGEEVVVEGRCEGVFGDQPRGTQGFGYDPCFIPNDTGADDLRTMAELDPGEKHAISHRGRAARRLAIRMEGAPAPEGRS